MGAGRPLVESCGGEGVLGDFSEPRVNYKLTLQATRGQLWWRPLLLHLPPLSPAPFALCRYFFFLFAAVL